MYFLQNVTSFQVMLMMKHALTFHTAWFYSNISVTKTKLSIVIIPKYKNSSFFWNSSKIQLRKAVIEINWKITS